MPFFACFAAISLEYAQLQFGAHVGAAKAGVLSCESGRGDARHLIARQHHAVTEDHRRGAVDAHLHAEGVMFGDIYVAARRLQFFLRKLLRSNQVPAYRTRQKLLRLLKLRFRKSLNLR